ncbi:MAG: hypothetical protein S4CHLAM2_00610 [Chlamydiales bacterium]|nr:hypothetical protein [Chlamydiales bacterium]
MGMISSLCGGAKGTVVGMARRSDAENGYSGWKRAAWLSLGVALTILGLAGIGSTIGGITAHYLTQSLALQKVLAFSGVGLLGLIPLVYGGAILTPAIGYHFKKVVHADIGHGEL